MRVLYFTSMYMYGNNGGIYASSAYVNAFSEIADEMMLVYPADSNQKDDLLHVQNRQIQFKPIYENIPRIFKFFKFLCGNLYRLIPNKDALFDDFKPDVVVLDSCMVASKAIVKRAIKRNIKIVTIHHNYQYEYVKADTIWYLKPLMLYYVRKYEKRAVNNSFLNLTLTPADILLLKEHYAKRDDVNFELLGVFERKDIPPRERTSCTSRGHKFVITGNLSNKQNLNPLFSWLDKYFPILKDIVPDLQLSIAGLNPPERLFEICKGLDIEIIPSPKSMQGVLDLNNYYICVTDVGGGLKLRIMDGLSSGMPVITHTISARGYEPFEESGSLFSYYDEESFKNAIIKAIQCKLSEKDIIDKYQSIFSFNAGVNRLKRILEQLKIYSQI